MFTKTVPFFIATLAALCGWVELARFSSTPGEQSAAPALLPAALFPGDLIDPARAPLLLVFIHPQCSCTSATLQEIDQLQSSSPAPARLVLVVYDSAALPRQAASHPDTWLHRPYRTLTDPNGRIARRFGAATSGDIVLYSANGRLLFQGGITPERAHPGDSPGLQALREALVSGLPGPGGSTQHSAVFGCPIFHLEHAG